MDFYGVSMYYRKQIVSKGTRHKQKIVKISNTFECNFFFQSKQQLYVLLFNQRAQIRYFRIHIRSSIPI